jgi:metal-responsive CopG/Arc/MetJ family transcriptional regulator
MSELSRIGVAIDSDLLAKFDDLIAKRGYTNRSEAFRDLIRDELIKETWESPDSEVVGTVTLVYDHHVRMLSEKLISRFSRRCMYTSITTTALKCLWLRVRPKRYKALQRRSSAPKASNTDALS